MLKAKDVTADQMLVRIFNQSNSPITPAAAKAIQSLTFPEADLKYMKYLAQRARDGRLTDSEHQQVEAYARVSSLLGILKAKARLATGKPASTKPARRS